MYHTLSNKGVLNNIVIIADENSYTNMFSDKNKRIATGAGRYYSLIPARMRSSCFHPKIYLFTSDNLLQLYIGSFNLTELGFMNNLELSGYFELDKADETSYINVQLFTDIHTFFQSLLKSNVIQNISNTCLQKIEKTLSAMTWTKDITSKNEKTTFNFISTLQAPIFDQIIHTIDFDIKRVKILGPEFGTDIEIIKTISKRYPKAEIQIFVKQNETSINKKSLEDFFRSSQISIKLIDIKPNEYRKIHAKYYAFEGEKEKIIFYGSANPSVNGFLRSYNKGGNVEVGIVKRFAVSHEQELFENDKIFENVQEISINDFVSTFTEINNQQEKDQIDTSLFSAEYKEYLSVIFDLEYDKNDVSSLIIQARHPSTTETIQIPVETKKICEENNVKKIQVSLNEKQKKFLSETTMVNLDITSSTGENFSSNWIWVDIYIESLDEKINQAINDCGISYVPNALIDLFAGESDIRMTLLDSLISIEKGIYFESKERQQKEPVTRRRNVVLPPDYTKTRKTGKDVASILENFLEIYRFNLERLVYFSEDEIETILDNFSDFILAILQVTIAVHSLSQIIKEKKYKDEIEQCKNVVRNAVAHIIRDSFVQLLVSRIDRTECINKEEIVNTYIKKQLLIRFLYIHLFLKKYDPTYFLYSDQGNFTRLFFSILDLEEDILKTFYTTDKFEQIFLEEENVMFSPLTKKPELISTKIQFFEGKKNLEEFIVLYVCNKGVSGILDYINRLQKEVFSIDDRSHLAPYTNFSALLSRSIKNQWSEEKKKILNNILNKKITEWKNKGFDQFKIKTLEYIKPEK